MALLLVHDFLLAKGGIALPQSHGLRQSVERHKGRLQSELTLARLRRKLPSLDALRAEVERASAGEEAGYPRWVRVNAIHSSVEEQLETTFSRHVRATSVQEVIASRGRGGSGSVVYIDPHVPGLLAVTQGTDLTKTEAYAAGKIILQDKASCFPAYLLDPHPEAGDVVDACAAPGNKTTHLAAILHARRPEFESGAASPVIYAFEKDDRRAKTLEKMVQTAGARKMTEIGPGQDFLHVDPFHERYKAVGALLLDPSCSGSGIVGRDSMPEVHLPEMPGGGNSHNNDSSKKKKTTANNINNKTTTSKEGDTTQGSSKKRKHGQVEDKDKVFVDDDGNEVVMKSEKDLEARLVALSAFQLSLVLHAFRFPAATRITYSTCSVHAEENEAVVMRALASDVARHRGWRILRRSEQVTGMREWPVRGVAEACGGDQETAEGCIRSYKDDGNGVMGFFVAGFVRDGDKDGDGNGDGNGDGDGDGPYVRDEDGLIMRDATGMPVLKSTGEPVELVPRDDEEEWTGFGD